MSEGHGGHQGHDYQSQGRRDKSLDYKWDSISIQGNPSEEHLEGGDYLLPGQERPAHTSGQCQLPVSNNTHFSVAVARQTDEPYYFKYEPKQRTSRVTFSDVTSDAPTPDVVSDCSGRTCGASGGGQHTSCCHT